VFSWCWAVVGTCRRENNRIVETLGGRICGESFLNHLQQLSWPSTGITSRRAGCLAITIGYPQPAWSGAIVNYGTFCEGKKSQTRLPINDNLLEGPFP